MDNAFDLDVKYAVAIGKSSFGNVNVLTEEQCLDLIPLYTASNCLISDADPENVVYSISSRTQAVNYLRNSVYKIGSAGLSLRDAHISNGILKNMSFLRHKLVVDQGF